MLLCCETEHNVSFLLGKRFFCHRANGSDEDNLDFRGICKVILILNGVFDRQRQGCSVEALVRVVDFENC